MSSDSGFMLIEVLVAITIVTIVMTSMVGVLVSATASTARQRSAQVASGLAVSAIDRARAVGAAGAVSGRDASSSASQLTHTPATPDYPAQSAKLAPWLSAMTTAKDATAASGVGASATLPTVPVHQQVNGLTFSVSYFVGYCWRPQAMGAGDCVATSSSNTVEYVRVVVAAAWSGDSCPAEGCAYVSATLLNGTGDPSFNFNQSPPPAPAFTPVVDQSNLVGDTVNGITASGCARPCRVTAVSGVPPLIFSATGLPPGLAMDASGLVTGTTTATGNFLVTAKVTDAFTNVATTTFHWKVGAA